MAPLRFLLNRRAITPGSEISSATHFGLPHPSPKSLRWRAQDPGDRTLARFPASRLGPAGHSASPPRGGPAGTGPSPGHGNGRPAGHEDGTGASRHKRPRPGTRAGPQQDSGWTQASPGKAHAWGEPRRRWQRPRPFGRPPREARAALPWGPAHGRGRPLRAPAPAPLLGGAPPPRGPSPGRHRTPAACPLRAARTFPHFPACCSLAEVTQPPPPRAAHLRGSRLAPWPPAPCGAAGPPAASGEGPLHKRRAYGSQLPLPPLLRLPPTPGRAIPWPPLPALSRLSHTHPRLRGAPLLVRS